MSDSQDAAAGKVFCIGTLKTGTTSMGRALRKLGYRHSGFSQELIDAWRRNDREALFAHARQFDSFDDWPWGMAEVYQQLDQEFPGSKFIYTDRDLISWSRSYLRYFYSDPDWAYGTPETFDDHFPELIMQRRNRKRRILDYFSDRPGDLLIVNVIAGDGWEKLCPFLGKPEPEEAFPHANRS